jgi:hypothetical protein
MAMAYASYGGKVFSKGAEISVVNDGKILGAGFNSSGVLVQAEVN